MQKTIRVSPKGWVTIPRRLREKYGLRPGTGVRFIEYAGALSIVPVPEDAVTEARGILRRCGGPESWTQALLEERGKEHRREEQKGERWVRP